MEVERLLADAWKAVEKAELPDYLHEVAFGKAVDVLVGARPAGAKPKAAGTGGSDGESHEDDGALPAKLGLVAGFFGLPADKVEDFFSEENDDLRFEFDVDKLASNTSERTRRLAVLLIAARQIGKYDSESTLIAVIRAECDRLGIYDADNFSSYMNKLKSTFIVSGSGRSRTYRLKPASREEAKKLMASLRG